MTEIHRPAQTRPGHIASPEAEAAWLLATAQNRPVSLGAADIDILLSGLYRTQSAVFQVTTALMAVSAGNTGETMSQALGALEEAKMGLASLNLLFVQLKQRAEQPPHDPVE